MTTSGRRLVQAAQGFYDRDANLALLRLYNFEAELVHVQTVANVLIMALMQLPEADFTMLLHLIPENIQVSVVHEEAAPDKPRYRASCGSVPFPVHFT